MHLALSWTMKYVFLFNFNKNKIIISEVKIGFLVVDLPRSCPMPADNNNKKFNTIGSDKLDQCSCSHLTY